jgi:UDP-galactopyranose mutase
VDTPPIVIIGAGPTGLSAAYHLGSDALLLEQNDSVGGWCRSIQSGSFTFDYAGHILFSNDPYVHELYRLLLGDNIHWQDREAWIYSHGVYTRYPFQGALYGLPPRVVTECLLGAIEARFGRASGVPHQPAASDGRVAALPCATPRGGEAGDAGIADCCADGLLEATAPLVDRPSDAPLNFEQFIYRTWGAGIAEHFALPYNRKLWAVPLDEMETSWLGGRVPMPDLREMLEGALQPSVKPMGPNARFGYVLRGGCQALMDAFVPHLAGELRLRTRVAGVSLRRRELITASGERVPFAVLINTMPLPQLVRLLGDAAPPPVRAAALGLRHVSVRCVNLGVAREHITDKHWVYYPEDTVFHRIFVQGNASPYCNPPGGFGLTCEITYSPDKPLPCDGAALIQRCVDDCVRVGMLRPDDRLLVGNQLDMPCAYVVYDHQRAAHVRTIRDWLTQHDIILAGRYAEWEYYNSDHAFLAGRTGAEAARAALRAAWPRPPADAATLTEGAA